MTLISSILDTIKTALGINNEDTSFDMDLIIHINSTFMVLNQLNVGPTTCFIITGSQQKWEDFFGDRVDLNAVKSYMFAKIKLLFDPPQNSFLVESLSKIVKEYEWRLNVQGNPIELEVEEEVEDE